MDRGRSIPESPRAFLSLWNYWDRTGGWGRYELISETEVEWRILVHNNFVHSDIGMDSRRLQRFWEGYIGGFLNHALPRISACMMRLPEKERALRVTMPAAAQVAAVRHDSQHRPVPIYSSSTLGLVLLELYEALLVHATILSNAISPHRLCARLVQCYEGLPR